MPNSFSQLILLLLLHSIFLFPRKAYLLLHHYMGDVYVFGKFRAKTWKNELISFTISVHLFVSNELRRVKIILMKFVVDTFQFCLKSVRNNGFFTWGPKSVSEHMSLNIYCSKKILHKGYKEKWTIHFIQCTFSVFMVFEIIKQMWGNTPQILDCAYILVV